MSNHDQISQLGRALSTTAVALFGSQNVEDTILSYSSPYKRVLHQAMTNFGSDGALTRFRGIGKDNSGSFQSLYSSMNGEKFFKNKFTDSKTSFKVLSYLSDDLLNDIPNDKAFMNLSSQKRLLGENGESKRKKKNNKDEPSLFQGFEASLPVINETLITKEKLAESGKIKAIAGSSQDENDLDDEMIEYNEQFKLPNNTNPKKITDSYSLDFLNGLSGQVTDSLDLLEIQKKVAASEIRELDYKLENLKFMRELVFKRIAKIEQNELFLENNLKLTRDRISFLQEYGLEVENETEKANLDVNRSTSTSSLKNTDDDDDDNNDDNDYEEGEEGEDDDKLNTVDIGDPRKEDSTLKPSLSSDSDVSSPLMSRSIYRKLKTKDENPSKKLHNFYHDHNRKHRKTYPTLQQYYTRGSSIMSLKQAHKDSITCLDFDLPFGTLCTAGHLDHSINIWDLSQKKKVGQMSGHLASISCMQMDNHYNMLITGGRDAVLKMWNLNLATQLYQENSGIIPSSESACVYTFDSHVDEITALSFDSGHLVSGSQDRTVRQWDLNSGKCLQTFDLSFAGRLGQGAPPAKTTMLTPTDTSPIIGALQCFDAALATGTKDGVVRLWDMRSGKIIRTLEGHTDAITSLKFDSRNLITGSLDRSVRTWDLRTGTLADAFAYKSPVLSLDFDLQNIVVAVGENAIQIVDRDEDKHWECGQEDEGESTTSQFVRYKDGYMIEGRSNGDVRAWAI